MQKRGNILHLHLTAKAFLAYALLLAAFFPSYAICAEITSLSAAGTTGIKMIAQDLRAVIDSESADISGMCHIIGNGTDRTVDVSMSYAGFAEMTRCSIFTDNENLNWQTETDDKSGITTVTFTINCPPKDEYLGIGLNMAFLFDSGKYGVEDTRLSWDLSPAKTWKGTVEDSRLTVYLRNANFELATMARPEPTSIDNNRVMWVIGDSEPSEKIDIAIMHETLYHTSTTARELIERDPDNAYTHFLLGATLLIHSIANNSGKITDSIEALETSLALESDHTGTLWYLAVAYHFIGRESDVERTLETLMSLEPSYHCKHRLFPEALMVELPGTTPKAWLDAVK